MFGFNRKVSIYIGRGASVSSRNIDTDIAHRFSFQIDYLTCELLKFPFLCKNVVFIFNANTNDE